MTAEDNGSGFPCAHCGSHDIRRSHRKNSFETFKMAFGIYPFRCLKCGGRFYGNIWQLSLNRRVKCPRCLRLNVLPSERKDDRKSAWQELLMSLGARPYRCNACRLNFVSFWSKHNSALANQ